MVRGLVDGQRDQIVGGRVRRDDSAVRVDLFDTGDNLYVGELTLYPGGGFEAFEPAEYDRLIGDKWVLPARRS